MWLFPRVTASLSNRTPGWTFDSALLCLFPAVFGANNKGFSVYDKYVTILNSTRALRCQIWSWLEYHVQKKKKKKTEGTSVQHTCPHFPRSCNSPPPTRLRKTDPVPSRSLRVEDFIWLLKRFNNDWPSVGFHSLAHLLSQRQRESVGRSWRL